MAREPFGWCIFCDDLREEVGGKQSYIGVYEKDMIINAPFPVALAKFAVVAKYAIDKTDEGIIDEDVFLNIYLPGDDDSSPSVSAPLPVRDIREKAIATDAVTSMGIFVLSARVVASPLQIISEGEIRVAVKRVNAETNIGVLVVKSTATFENPYASEANS